MSKPNETVALLLALGVTGAIVAGGGWWLWRSGLFTQGPDSAGQNGLATSSSRLPTENLASRISSGEVLLVPNPSNEKQRAAQALAGRDYARAVSLLEASLQANRNDPEALIYLNNARIGKAESYAIAVAVPIDGNLDSAAEILRGVAQAQQDINQAGGINGRPLRVFIADDANQPDFATSIAQRLADNRDILGVIGHHTSDSSKAAGAVYQQQGVPMISPTSTAVDLTNEGTFIFRTVPSDRFTAAALVRYLLENFKLTKAALFFDAKSNYSNSLKDAFTTDLFSQGGEVVGEFDLSDPNFNPSDALQQARDRGAQALALLPSSNALDPALQVMQLNTGNLPLLAGDAIYSSKTLELGRTAAVGTIVATPWHVLAHQDSPFPPAAQQLWGGDVSWRTAMAYDATKALAAAIARNPSRQGIQQALTDSNFSAEGATTPVRFLPSGDRNQAVQLVTVQPGNRTRFGFEFVPVP